MAETILVTGGCGFIGTNFVRHMLVDKLTYAGKLGAARAEVRNSILVEEKQDVKCRGRL